LAIVSCATVLALTTARFESFRMTPLVEASEFAYVLPRKSGASQSLDGIFSTATVANENQSILNREKRLNMRETTITAASSGRDTDQTRVQPAFNAFIPA
jgi:hypothetical protein